MQKVSIPIIVLLFIAVYSCQNEKSANFSITNNSDSEVLKLEIYKYTSYKNLEYNWDTIPILKIAIEKSYNNPLETGRYYLKIKSDSSESQIFHFWVNDDHSARIKYKNDFTAKDRLLNDYNLLMIAFSRYDKGSYSHLVKNIRDIDNIFNAYMDSLNIVGDLVSDTYRNMIIEEKLYLTATIHPIISDKFNNKIGNFFVKSKGTLLHLRGNADSINLEGFYKSNSYKDFLAFSLDNIKLVNINDPFIEGKYFSLIKLLDLDLKSAPYISEFLDSTTLPLNKFVEDQISYTKNQLLAENLLVELADNNKENRELSLKYNSWLITDFYEGSYVQSGKAQKMITFHKLQIGSQAPELLILGIDGEKIVLSDYSGKYLLIDFWGTWCAPCRDEIPELNRLFTESSQYDLEIIGIAKDKGNTLRLFLDSIDVKYRLAFASDKVISDYGVLSYPEKFLLDKSGKILKKNISLIDVIPVIKKNKK